VTLLLRSMREWCRVGKLPETKYFCQNARKSAILSRLYVLSVVYVAATVFQFC